MNTHLNENRTIEELASRFNEDWLLDLEAKQIRRRKRTWLWAAKDLVWPRRHTVFAMYWWAKRLCAGKLEENQADYLRFFFPLEHGNMPVSVCPMKYGLTNWTIPKRDLRYFIRGPLVAGENFDDVLVDDRTTRDRIVELWRKLTTPAKAILWIMGTILTLFAFKDLTMTLFS